MLHVLASFAEFERNLGIERTRAGLAAARARGRIGGRQKSIPDPKRSAAEVAKEVGVSRATFYTEFGLRNAPDATQKGRRR